jgi:feruloyl esterase
MNDGVADGIVGDYLGCHYDPYPLRCPNGADADDKCLSDIQLKTIAAIYGRKSWKDAAGKEILSYARFLVGGGEGDPGALSAWILGKAPLPRPQAAGAAMNFQVVQKLGLSTGSFYGNTGVRYLIARDPSFDTLDFNPAPHAQQIHEVANLINSNDPNVVEFQKRGGKLIIIHNTADMAVSPVATMNYYDAMVKVLGKDAVNKFVRLYIVPGGDHGGRGAPSNADLLGLLDRWVTNGVAPGNDVVAEEYDLEGTVVRSKPLCEYPYYPRYVGSGDSKSSSSYKCTISSSARVQDSAAVGAGKLARSSQ